MLSQPENKSVLHAFSLKGKIALITGGNRGIGLEISAGFLEAGAEVAIICRSKSSGDSAAAKLEEKHGSKVRAYLADVADNGAVEAAVQNILTDFGGLDIAVANAGIGEEIEALNYSAGAFREVMAVNLDGAFHCAKAAATYFKTQGRGNIIFTASISASIVNVEPQAPYNASKAGLVHLAKSLAVEWIDFARVNCISPGYIETDMLANANVPDDLKTKWLTPSGRLGQTYELKGAYVFCASDASSFMTGANLVIDGGYSLP